jgi:hypothetical protein
MLKKIHKARCLGYICTCPTEVQAAESIHTDDCQCTNCHDEREALKDREFDEKAALGYI